MHTVILWEKVSAILVSILKRHCQYYCQQYQY